MATAEQPKRRFAPVPIETTFESVRQKQSKQQSQSQSQQQHVGPQPELTPEPSPRSPSPVPTELRERRRFKPQLIETSRRSRRTGDEGPATKPADKTDITPYTNHIYSAKHRHRRKHDGTVDGEPSRPVPPTRRESEDEHVQEYLLDLAAKEAERQIQEAALAAFPNSRAREGGVAHFYFRESSGSDESPGSATPGQKGAVQRVRRKSSDLGLNWWHQHMQEHAQQRGDKEIRVEEPPVEQDSIMRSDSDLDAMDFDLPPDPIWTTSRRVSAHERSANERRDSTADASDGLLPPGYAEKLAKKRAEADAARKAAGEDSAMTDAPPTSTPKQERGFQSPGGFGGPFGGFLGLPADDPKVQRMRKMASPPMLGGDLTFRTCPSPKVTKLEPDHVFSEHVPEQDTEMQDWRGQFQGQVGLWRGYCTRSDSQQGFIVPIDAQKPAFMSTPYQIATPSEPVNGGDDSYFTSQEPASIFTASDSSNGTASTSEPRARHEQQARSAHMLQSIDEKLLREKFQSERYEKIAQEFDDAFITQVYNYLSLGYPAMARAYDEELSKISRFSIDELEKDDAAQAAKGHFLEMKLEDTPEEQRCPRWKALRVYITQWARQHPDLDSLDPLAWGVRERRGSWAI